MAGMASLLLLTALAAVSTHKARAQQLPDSFVLLPLSAFTDSNQTTLVSDYNCDASYASSPCSGHGSCYLLLDSAANSTQPFVNAVAVQPTPVSQSSLDTYGVDSSARLPAAVCVCDSGWTGRGDYINHDALSGDSCHVNQSVVVGLCITGIVVMSLLVIVALHRLFRWSVWHVSCLSAISGPTAGKGETRVSAHSYHSSEEADARVNDTTKHNSAPQPLSPRTHTPSHATQAASSVTGRPPPLNTASPVLATRQALQTTKARATLGTNEQPVVYATQAQRQALWIRNLSHITFVHPFCSLLVGSSVLTYLILRLTTAQTIGNSYILSALMYVQHQPFCVAISMGTANNLAMAASFTRTTTGATGLSTVIRAAKRYLMGLCVYSFFGWLLLWFIPAYHSSQQTLAVLILLLGFLPDLLIGPISVSATQRVTAALVRHLELLSAEQQHERRTAYKKLRSFSYIITAIVAANGAFCVVFACSAVLRQSGLPLFALAWHLSMFLILVVRLLLLKPPYRNGASTAVTVHPTSPGSLTIAVRGVTASNATSPSAGRLPLTPAGKWSAEPITAASATQKPALSVAVPGLEEVGDGRSYSGAMPLVPLVSTKRDSATGVMVESGFDS